MTITRACTASLLYSRKEVPSWSCVCEHSMYDWGSAHVWLHQHNEPRFGLSWGSACTTKPLAHNIWNRSTHRHLEGCMFMAAYNAWFLWLLRWQSWGGISVANGWTGQPPMWVALAHPKVSSLLFHSLAALEALEGGGGGGGVYMWALSDGSKNRKQQPNRFSEVVVTRQLNRCLPGVLSDIGEANWLKAVWKQWLTPPLKWFASGRLPWEACFESRDQKIHECQMTHLMSGQAILPFSDVFGPWGMSQTYVAARKRNGRREEKWKARIPPTKRNHTANFLSGHGTPTQVCGVAIVVWPRRDISLTEMQHNSRQLQWCLWSKNKFWWNDGTMCRSM